MPQAWKVTNMGFLKPVQSIKNENELNTDQTSIGKKQWGSSGLKIKNYSSFSI